MKHLFASILAMSVVACAVPPEPEPEPEAEATLSSELTAADTNAGDPFRVQWFCVNNIGPSCIGFPTAFPNSRTDCIHYCQLDGTPNPICRITLQDRIEC